MIKNQTTKDLMGNRMKSFELHETQRRSMTGLPICVRLDGRAFHTFTKGLNRPFDEGMVKAMVETSKFLVRETYAKIGYTQSDEITLVFCYKGKAQPLFGGKFFKLTSVIASLATAKFNSLIPELIPSKAGKLATFDARVFQTPSLGEAANLLLWRWLDAKKNSVSATAEAHYSSKQLLGKTTQDRLEMLNAKGIDWHAMPDAHKWGTFVRRETVLRELSVAELSRIPVNHRPDGPVPRTEVVKLTLPPLVEVEDRVTALFGG